MSKGASTLWTIAMLAGALPAHASDFYLEGPGHETRAEAVGETKTAEEAGLQGRVVRRYQQGDGWRYLVRVEGFTEEAPAREAAVTLATRIHQPVSIFVAEGEEAKEVGVEQPSTSEPLVDLTGQDAASIVKRAVKAHGGAKGGIDAIEASARVVFEFRRTLPSGLIADHVWSKRDGDRYLSIQVVEGEGRSSRMIIDGDAAWLGVDAGSYEATDLARAKEAMDGFDPEDVIPFVLVFAHAAENRRELEALAVQGSGDVEGRPAVVLAYDGDRTSGPLVIKVDRQRWHVLEVSFDGGELMHRFDGYGETAGVVVPGRVRTWRGGELVDTVEIKKLDVSASPPDAWFQAG